MYNNILERPNLNEWIPVLQYRWKLDDNSHSLLYFGLRNYPNQLNNKIKITGKLLEIIHAFDGEKSLSVLLEQDKSLDEGDYVTLKNLMDEGVIVEKSKLRKPATRENHQSCIRCVNNDNVLQGLEFDKNGLCAFCQCVEKAKEERTLKVGGNNVVTGEELREKLADNKSRFDVMVLYTGGKDSSYLLWYLAKKLGLRVLACTWDMPFNSETTLRNIKNAQKKLPNVEFITRTIAPEDLKKAYRELVFDMGLPCPCPWISYALFYPIAVYEKIPVIMDGIEAAQMLMSNALEAASSTKKKEDTTPAKEYMLNYLRLISSSDESKSSSFMYNFIKKTNKVFSPVFDQLREIINHEEQYTLPQMLRLSSESVYKTWTEVRDIIQKELDWEMPAGQTGLLHTSCQIETYKDYFQYKSFSDMSMPMFQESVPMFPQSIIELSSAIHFGQITREEALKELEERGYENADQAINKVMKELDIECEDLSYSENMHPIVRKIFTSEGKIRF